MNTAQAHALSLHLKRLEAESIAIMREVAAEFRNPVMLYSIGKDSSVMLHLALKAFYPVEAAVSAAARRYDLEIPRHDRHPRPDRASARRQADRPYQPGGRGARHQPDRLGLAAAHPGDEDRGAETGARQVSASTRLSAARAATRRRAAPRSASSRSARPATSGIRATSARSSGSLYNTRINKGETIRVFPLSNWTELDIWQYTRAEDIPVVPLYFAAERPVVKRDGLLIMRDDDRLPLLPGEQPEMRAGALPLARLLSAVRGDREQRPRSLDDIIAEMLRDAHLRARRAA